MQGANVIKQLKVTTPKIVPLATEVVTKRKSILRNPDGKGIVLKPHQMTRDLKKFLEDAGFSVDYEEVQRLRGKTEMAGISVEVHPVMHTHYDGGVLIRIGEESASSYENTNKILEFLIKNGISISKECTFSQEAACLFKSKTTEEPEEP